MSRKTLNYVAEYNACHERMQAMVLMNIINEVNEGIALLNTLTDLSE